MENCIVDGELYLLLMENCIVDGELSSFVIDIKYDFFSLGNLNKSVYIKFSAYDALLE